MEELETLKCQYADRDNELVRLQELIERLQTDKTKLSRRVSKLVLNGRVNMKHRRVTANLSPCHSRERSSTRIAEVSPYDQSTDADRFRRLGSKETFASRSAGPPSEECRRRT